MSVAEEALRAECEAVTQILKDGDWNKCATPQMGRVYRHFNTCLSSLVTNSNRPFWQEWMNRAPYAAAIIICFFLWLYVQSGGKLPMLPISVAGATTTEEVVNETDTCSTDSAVALQ